MAFLPFLSVFPHFQEYPFPKSLLRVSITVIDITRPLIHCSCGLPSAVHAKACLRGVLSKYVYLRQFNLFVLFRHMTRCGFYLLLVCKSFNESLFDRECCWSSIRVFNCGFRAS